MRLTVSFYFLIGILFYISITPFIFSFSQTTLILDLLIFAALAYSINFITGMTGYVSFGHVFFMAVGSYTLVYMSKVFNLYPLFTIPLVGLIGALFAFVIGYITLRFRGVYFALSTLVIALASYYIVLVIPALGANEGLIFNVRFEPLIWFYTIFSIVALEAIITYFINHSRTGYAIRAIKDDEDAAIALGINSMRIKLILFIISGTFGALAGGVFAWSTAHVYPTEIFDLQFSLQMLAMILIGGMGTVFGPFIGAAIVYLLTYYLITILPNGQLIIIGLAVILVALFVPMGIVGSLRNKIKQIKQVVE
jgi:branched-chain amino acid transport system permease protein